MKSKQLCYFEEYNDNGDESIVCFEEEDTKKHRKKLKSNSRIKR